MNGKFQQTPRTSKWRQLVDHLSLGPLTTRYFRAFMVHQIRRETSERPTVPGLALGTKIPPEVTDRDFDLFYRLEEKIQPKGPHKRHKEVRTLEIWICRLCTERRLDDDTWQLHENECEGIAALAVRTVKDMIQKNDQVMINVATLFPEQTKAACAELLVQLETA